MLIEEEWGPKCDGTVLYKKGNSGKEIMARNWSRGTSCYSGTIRVWLRQRWHGMAQSWGESSYKKISEATYSILDMSAGFLLIGNDNKGSLSMNFVWAVDVGIWKPEKEWQAVCGMTAERMMSRHARSKRRLPEATRKWEHCEEG